MFLVRFRSYNIICLCEWNNIVPQLAKFWPVFSMRWVDCYLSCQMYFLKFSSIVCLKFFIYLFIYLLYFLFFNFFFHVLKSVNLKYDSQIIIFLILINLSDIDLFFGRFVEVGEGIEGEGNITFHPGNDCETWTGNNLQ